MPGLFRPQAPVSNTCSKMSRPSHPPSQLGTTPVLGARGSSRKRPSLFPRGHGSRPQQHAVGVSFIRRMTLLSTCQLLHWESIFIAAPRWHTACTRRCNGRKHERSRAPLTHSHPVSLVPSVASRRIIPWLRRTGRFRPAAAPSCRDGSSRAAHGIGAAGRAANIHCQRRQRLERFRDLERERHSRRQRHRRDDQQQRRLYSPRESSFSSKRYRAGRQCG
jgi:hypothetical protein